MEYNEYNPNGQLDWFKKNTKNPTTNTFAGDEPVNTLLRKIKMFHKLETKTFEFKDEPGQVAKRLTIVVDFDEVDFPVQPHTGFEEMACESLLGWAGNEINGLIENIEYDDEN